MNLRIPADGSSGAGLQTVLLGLAQQALDDVVWIESDPECRTHAIRTGMKKFRALLQLARRDMSRRRFRELRRLVAELKDSLSGARDRVVVAAIAAEVLEKAQAEEEVVPVLPDAALADVAKALERSTRDLDLENLDSTTLRKRWKRTRRRARAAGKRARKSGGSEDFHRWRKRVKSLWYQSDALNALSGDAAALVKPAQTLSGILGREHDLTMAMEALSGLSKPERRKLGRRRGKCRRKAFAAARDL